MSDRAVFGLALAVVLGALAGASLEATSTARALVVAGVLTAGAAWVARRPVALVAGALALAAGLSSQSWAGVAPPTGDPRVAGTATVAGDPVDVRGGVRVELRLADGRRVEAWASGEPAARLRERLAGERVAVEGRLRPVAEEHRRRMALRHVGARLEVEAVHGWSPGSPPARLANALRRTLERGARPLDDVDRSLLLGVVLGDDRGRPVTLTDDFRAAGLSHLLAVSGQNVA